MTAEFVPFLPALRNRASAAPAPTADGFAPFAAGAPAAAPSPKPRQEPRVEVKRNGDRITQIQITCGCGEVVEIDCQY